MTGEQCNDRLTDPDTPIWNDLRRAFGITLEHVAADDTAEELDTEVEGSEVDEVAS